MLIDEIKKANMVALKNHDTQARAALSVLINKYMLLSVENRAKGVETTDGDTLTLVQKSVKELEEEKKMYLDNQRQDKVEDIQAQIKAISVFLPQLMSEEEIKKIIMSLEDRSIKNVMMVFKKQYQGQADMSLVSKIAKSLN